MSDLLKELSGFDEYVPGKGIDEVAFEHGLSPDEMAKLASNENPLGPPDAAVERIRRNVDGANIYPTALNETLRQKVAEYIGVPEGNVVLGAGADGVFDTVGRAVIEDGDSVLTPSPGFSYYGMSARYLGGNESSFSLSKEDGFEMTPEAVLDAYSGEKIIYLTTPNNPTGTSLTKDGITEIADEVDGLVFVDEAYGEFSDQPSFAPEAVERDDVAVARTFSKAFGLAGLRVGYGVVPDWLAAAYRKVTTPFSVGTLSLHGAIGALEDDGHLEDTVDLVEWGRGYLSSEIELPTFESEANFVLVDVEPSGMSASEVAEELEKRGIIVRDTTSFGLPGCIRVSVGTDDETRRAVREINAVCA
ncbi:MAG: histidinol-phosphate transaminase [Halobacteria archaeon]|nr:histidinol-phosphate transaminase [Halobacteria archaeon]